MRPYFDDGRVVIYNADCRDVLPSLDGGVIITDPPFNIGYRYDGYSDSIPKEDYVALLALALRVPSVLIHYPEAAFLVARSLGVLPTKCAAWVYHANTFGAQRWRMVSWFGVEPDFSLVHQPYQNPTDKRVRERIATGSPGSALYDWWLIEQVKNVSDEKTAHPCQMPLAVMQNIVGVTPGDVIIDPFMGSGTTLVVAKALGRRAVGIELSERYCEIAAQRLSQETLGL